MTPPTIALFAKAPKLGQVKTRLTKGDGALAPGLALTIHTALLNCMLTRLAALPGPVTTQRILATDAPNADVWRSPGSGLERSRLEKWSRVDQGEGRLGTRLARVGRRLHGGFLFFGVDCPDVPQRSLEAAVEEVTAGRFVLGRVSDGGYWCLGGPRFDPRLVLDIEWDADDVADQTLRNAADASIDLHLLPPWFDVDHPADARALKERLEEAEARGGDAYPIGYESLHHTIARALSGDEHRR